MNSSLFAKQICVTGSMGSGKSRVAQFLADYLYLPYIDVDEIARVIMAPDEAGLRLVGEYNPGYLREDGSLNRSLLRNDIFTSAKVKEDIDGLLHPLIYTVLKTRMQIENKRTIIEIPLVFETKWDVLFETIIVVSADKKTCLKRIIERDHVFIHEAERAYDSQMDIAIKKTKATFVIENGGDWQDTIENIREIATKIY